MKNKIVKERRSVNIDKTDFDIIKEHCDTNALNMTKWLVKIALEKINNKGKGQ